jgi:hypothetical protein
MKSLSFPNEVRAKSMAMSGLGEPFEIATEGYPRKISEI